MPVAADIDVQPSLEEVRELAREHSVVPLRHTFISDTETPVSAYLRLRGRRRFDVAPDAAMPGPDLGPPPGHWTGTLTWSLTATLTRCRTVLGHRRCAF